MATEAEPNATVEKIKWHNRRDEAYRLLCLSISRDLLFHIDSLTSPNEVWEKICCILTDHIRLPIIHKIYTDTRDKNR